MMYTMVTSSLKVPWCSTTYGPYLGVIVTMISVSDAECLFVRAMNNDAEVYPEPEEYRPERFLDETGTKDAIPPITHGEAGLQS